MLKLSTFITLILFFTLQLNAQQATILKDINPGTEDGFEYAAVAVAAGKYFFIAKSPTEGRELWVTDGTTAGTQLVKDFTPGVGDGVQYSQLVVFKDKVWFTAETPDLGLELWSSDGTEAGTVAYELAAGLYDSYANNLAAGADYLYFTASDEASSFGLYRTDGTAAGTERIITDLGTSGTYLVDNIVTLGNTAYISLAGPAAGQLWKSDGTAAGTVMVTDITPGGFGKIQKLTAALGKVYFAGSPNFFGDYQPWVVDPASSTGATKLKDINPNGNSDTKWFFPFKGKVYFYAVSSNFAGGFWRTDGTVAGTELFKQISISGPDNEVPNMAANNDYLYFAGYHNDFGKELWRTDGTSAGTTVVKDINPGFSSSEPSSLTLIDGKLYFSANDGDGDELWRSNGTETGTSKITDFFPGSATHDSPRSISALGHNLIFASDHPDYGIEPFTLDITSATLTPQPNVALSLSPNPASGSVYLTLPEDALTSAATLRILRADGTLVWQGVPDGTQTRISVGSLSSGLYQLEYLAGNSWGREKLVIVH